MSNEEKYPLLLLFVEDGDKRPSRNHRVVYDKSRYKGITDGASNVINQWPGHVASCWLTTVMIILILISATALIMAATLRSHSHMVAKCKTNHNRHANENVTVYLTHGPEPWTQNQLIALRTIAESYDQCDIELVLIGNALDEENQANLTSSTSAPAKSNGTLLSDASKEKTTRRAKRNFKPHRNALLERFSSFKRIKRDKPSKQSKRKQKPQLHKKWKQFIEFNINIGAHPENVFFHRNKLWEKHIAFLNAIKKSPPSLSLTTLLKQYPQVRVINTTYEDVFENSMLKLSWRNLNEQTRLFAVRVLCLWDSGGLTFELPGDLVKNAEEKNQSYTSKFNKAIDVGFPTYTSLPQGVVTIDEEGLHMETKTPCHAFFEELLRQLLEGRAETTPSEVISKTLRAFCKRGAVDSRYCSNFRKLA